VRKTILVFLASYCVIGAIFLIAAIALSQLLSIPKGWILERWGYACFMIGVYSLGISAQSHDRTKGHSAEAMSPPNSDIPN